MPVTSRTSASSGISTSARGPISPDPAGLDQDRHVRVGIVAQTVDDIAAYERGDRSRVISELLRVLGEGPHLLIHVPGNEVRQRLFVSAADRLSELSVRIDQRDQIVGVVQPDRAETPS